MNGELHLPLVIGKELYIIKTCFLFIIASYFSIEGHPHGLMGHFYFFNLYAFIHSDLVNQFHVLFLVTIS